MGQSWQIEYRGNQEVIDKTGLCSAQGAEVEKLLQHVADGVELVQSRHPCLVIIHTVTGAP